MNKIEKLADSLVALPLSEIMKLDVIDPALNELSVAELVELKKILKDKYGLEEAQAIVAKVEEKEVAKVEEKTSFKVTLTKVSEVTAEKLNAVKIVNRILAVGLKQAMDLAKEGNVILKEGVSKEEAEQIKAEFAMLNAVVELS